ncbi:hypothetical protein CDAR_105121 [Caerostris darwini]|uniref:Uncharacterized protein n=1 Tax=Caerostris darwini TaxID=1538125 RepID=A0AAV4V5W3_9ARAC|nr:hypothetical protein CDAR_105121 [Caerostris darwini]
MGQPHVRPVKWNVRNCGCSNFFCGCPIKDETLYGWMCSVAGKRIEDFSGGIDQTLENVVDSAALQYLLNNNADITNSQWDDTHLPRYVSRSTDLPSLTAETPSGVGVRTRVLTDPEDYNHFRPLVDNDSSRLQL